MMKKIMINLSEFVVEFFEKKKIKKAEKYVYI